MSSFQREAAAKMLKRLHDWVKSDYYDPQWHGVDLDERYKEAREKLARATTFVEAYGLAAWLLEPLNDTHTFFLPPARPYRVEYGWRMKFVGGHCYLTAVQPGSDAANQGLQPGDEVLGMEGFGVERDSVWKLRYAFEVLAPRSGVHLTIAAPNSTARDLLVKARVEKLPKVINLDFDWRDQDEIRMAKPRYIDLGCGVLAFKLPRFDESSRELDHVLTQSAGYRALILDLRSNPGGRESVLLEVLGKLLDHDAQIGQRVSRTPRKPVIVKAARGSKRFSGKLIVLVDSDSRSAAEIFARVIQLEKRGIVIGDRSSGRVMEARIYETSTEAGLFALPFGLELTLADLLMTDGKSLEGNGVVPDELSLPSPGDLAAGRDPVLSRAAQLGGVALTPEKAGTLFPELWRSF